MQLGHEEDKNKNVIETGMAGNVFDVEHYTFSETIKNLKQNEEITISLNKYGAENYNVLWTQTLISQFFHQFSTFAQSA